MQPVGDVAGVVLALQIDPQLLHGQFHQLAFHQIRGNQERVNELWKGNAENLRLFRFHFSQDRHKIRLDVQLCNHMLRNRDFQIFSRREGKLRFRLDRFERLVQSFDEISGEEDPAVLLSLLLQCA